MSFLTGITHGRPDRFRPEVRSVDERVSLDAVTNAIADIMGDHNRFGIADRALASRIARDVQTAVASAVGTGRISSSAQLTSQQAFWGILAQHLATTSSSYMDQEARRSFLHYVRHNANRTGPDFANFVAQFLRGGGYADRGSDRDGAGLVTSARFDGFSGADAALLARMRDVAIRHGLHWAADRHEILRLGEEAIRLLARTGFTRESHDRLEAAGFNHRDMVHIARYADRHGLDVNEVSSETAAAVDSFGADSPEARQRWIDRFRRFYDNPSNREAQEDMSNALTEMETRGTDEQRDRARRMREITGRASRALDADNTETDTARAEREAREAADRAREAERIRAEELRAREAAEIAAREAERRRVAALMAGDDPPGDSPRGPGPQQGPAAGAGHQRAEAAPPRLTTVAPT